jgi:hypothetical protein
MRRDYDRRAANMKILGIYAIFTTFLYNIMWIELQTHSLQIRLWI